ncbi:MAG: hypothetical protein GC154_00505 [bacterium]|nr:hypothetical protein [bacterium]
MRYRRWIGLLLVFVFCLDGASTLVSTTSQASRNVAIDEEQCHCTCCGDVCPMGKACCCYDKNHAANRLILAFQPQSCQPDGAVELAASSFWMSVKWVPSDGCASDTHPHKSSWTPISSRPLFGITFPPLTPPPQSV